MMSETLIGFVAISAALSHGIGEVLARGSGGPETNVRSEGCHLVRCVARTTGGRVCFGPSVSFLVPRKIVPVTTYSRYTLYLITRNIYSDPLQHSCTVLDH